MEIYFGNIALLCGIVFLAAGFITYKWPPKEINGLYGYRTGSSMKSQERWDFAQAYSAVLMMRGGAAMAVAGLLMALFKVEIPVITTVGMVLLFVVTGYLLYSTERAIKNKFQN